VEGFAHTWPMYAPVFSAPHAWGKSAGCIATFGTQVSLGSEKFLK